MLELELSKSKSILSELFIADESSIMEDLFLASTYMVRLLYILLLSTDISTIIENSRITMNNATKKQNLWKYFDNQKYENT